MGGTQKPTSPFQNTARVHKLKSPKVSGCTVRPIWDAPTALPQVRAQQTQEGREMVAKASAWQGLTPAALLLPVAFPADIQSPRPGNRQA